MTRLESAHLSGLQFDWVITRDLRFIDNRSETRSGGPLANLVADVQVESQVDATKRSCRVLVRVTLAPPDTDLTLFQTIVAAVEGQFTEVSPKPSVDLAVFAKRQAPAIIMPFVREAIASATAKSRFGQVLLPPINVVALTEALEPDQSRLPLAAPSSAKL